MYGKIMRFLKIGILILALFVLIVSTVSIGFASDGMKKGHKDDDDDKCSGGPGAIWAMHADGSKDDEFYPGEDVYLGGHKFEPNEEYEYRVLDMDNNKKILASGTVRTDSNGNITLDNPVNPIFQIPDDDYAGHKYRIDLIYEECNSPCQIFTKKDSFSTIPEFPTIAIPAIAVIGLVMLMRRRTG